MKPHLVCAVFFADAKGNTLWGGSRKLILRGPILLSGTQTRCLAMAVFGDPFLVKSTRVASGQL
jgi:hypothetical protein